MNITFTGDYAYYSDTGVVSFEAFVDGDRIVFKITDEALQDHFPDLGDSVKIYLANREAIEGLGIKYVERFGVPDNKVIVIKTGDIL